MRVSNLFGGHGWTKPICLLCCTIGLLGLSSSTTLFALQDAKLNPAAILKEIEQDPQAIFEFASNPEAAEPYLFDIIQKLQFRSDNYSKTVIVLNEIARFTSNDRLFEGASHPSSWVRLFAAKQLAQRELSYVLVKRVGLMNAVQKFKVATSPGTETPLTVSPKRLTPIWTQLLRDKNSRVRARVTQELSLDVQGHPMAREHISPEFTKALFELLQEKDSLVSKSHSSARDNTIQLLGNLAEHFRPRLRAALDSQDAAVRSAAAHSLYVSRKIEPASVERLLKLVEEPDVAVSRFAVLALSHADEREREISEAVKARWSEPILRNAILQNLSTFSDRVPENIKWIEQQGTTDESALVRRNSLSALGNSDLEVGRLVELVKRAITDVDVGVRYAAYGLAGKLGKDARSLIPRLEKRFERAKSSERFRVVYAILVIDRENELPWKFYRSKLKDADSRVSDQIGVLSRLQRLGPVAVEMLPELLEILKSDEVGGKPAMKFVRLKIVKILGRIGPQARSALPELQRVANDRQSTPGMKTAALKAIELIKPDPKR